MTETTPDSPNAAQIEFWNGTAAERWTTHQQAQDPALAPLGEAVMDALAIAPGEAVIDIGCGCGGTTLEIARRVGGSGHVLGVDVSAPMLARARERAAAAPDLAIDFALGDAAAHDFVAGAFDVAFSRIGVMFFADPQAAFANMLAALRPGARLGFVCWRTLKENQWATLPIDVATRHVPAPQRAGPEDPGPFSFRDAGRIHRILAAAGFTAVEIEPLDRALNYGPTVEAATVMTMGMGPISNAIMEAPDDVQQRIADDMRQALVPKLRDGGVFLNAGCWLVTARAGGG